MNMLHSVTWAAVLLAGGAANQALASYERAGVTVEVLDEHGRSFEEYPLTDNAAYTYRAYLKARRGAPYRIRVSNRTGERVGVVIAVDGRNIVSGQKSDLAPRESMYVLDPWESGDYRGWRTNLNDVHEFYFTEWQDSYAEAFNDRSARGVIAMAVYRDREWQRRLEEERRREEEQRRYKDDATGERAAPAPSEESADARKRSSAQDQGVASAVAPPGTGFGERRYDPARPVEFAAENRPMSRSFIKYEWPETLCRKGIACDESDRRQRHRHNRFWPDDNYGFAPYPPGRR
jgi:hypothetical protein